MDKNLLNNESSIRSNSSHYNMATSRKQLVHEEVNTAYNHHIIVKACEEGRARDIADEPALTKPKNALIIGSGASLDEALPLMNKWTGGIFCTTSHALTLMRYGIEPTHIVALDPFCTWEEIEGIDWSKTKTKLITHPGVWPSLIEKWPNEMLLYIENIGRPDSFYATVQKRQYSHRIFHEPGNIRDCEFRYYIKTEVAIFACSPAIQLFFANKLGYTNSFLVGVDLGFINGKKRFTEYTVKKIIDGNIEWEEHKHPFTPDEKTIYSKNGIPTEEIHLYYKKNIISAWRLAKCNLYTTDKGIITEIPYVDFKKVIKHGGFRVPNQKESFIADRAEKYLASVGAYVIYTDKGLSFVEAPEGLPLLKEYMKNVDSLYFCPVCKNHMNFHDDKTHIDEKCPACNIEGTKIQKVYNINIPANIKRLEKLVVLDKERKEVKENES